MAIERRLAQTGPRRPKALCLATAILLPLIGLGAPPAFGMHLSATGTSVVPIATIPGYQVSVFVKGTAAYLHPDSLVYDGTHVFVAYQNVTAKDGSDNKTSTIVEYTMAGRAMRTFSIPGHSDGLRLNPATHVLWALSNEDGNPRLTTVDPTSGAITSYQFPATPHGGGFDDLAFTHGMAFIDASAPNLDKNGINVFPALDKVILSDDKIVLTPVLMGNALAMDIATHKKVALNLVDPDSMTFDPQGNLVLDNQSGASLVFISQVGTPRQHVSQLSIGGAVDDTIWATAPTGRVLIADTSMNTVYAMRGTFVPGTVYSASPNDSGVASVVSTINQISGIITPIAVGFKSPHGMAFVPDAPHS